MKFSVITPLYIYDEKRKKDFLRSCVSLSSQSFRDFEHIIIDQTENEDWEVRAKGNYLLNNVKVIRQDHVERVFALREGFKQAEGEWICLLDSDDIYLPHYLETVNAMIEQNPEQKLFNFGNIYIYKDGRVTTRDAFQPKKLEVGHEIFNGGTVVNGTFVFKRELWEELGDFPTTTDKLWNPWDFSMAAQEEFPELKTFFVVDHPDHPEGCPKELGNPWGQDYYLFYKYTRKYHSLAVNKHLYGVYAK
jgi:glycosyltransferase involved in cell wall biosynthesis